MADVISFDYAIKYLLKDKHEYDIVEGFLSALLKSQGYSAVKITALLDSESNKEDRWIKRSIADVIVQDEEGNNYIIEIDRSHTSMFLHKAVFNTSRLIVDSLNTNQDYCSIKKVFHVNLLYFPFSSGKTSMHLGAPMYHGQVVFHEIDTQHPIDMHLINRKYVIFDSHNIFPEYFVISVPLFNDVIKQELDEWLYMLKHSAVKEEFQSPYIKKAAERLNILKMSPKERYVYDTYVMDTLKARDYVVTAENKGRQEGWQEGIQIGEARGEARGIEKTAIKMLKAQLDLNLISSITGLSEDEILKLKSQL